jgi:AcrR family transcriptional regulator
MKYGRENARWQPAKHWICALRNTSAKLFKREEARMKAQKHDRRSERTRRLLGEALVSLMLESRYADLTVQDILDRANIGRSTFYAHYWDKDDLLSSEMERVLEVLGHQVEKESSDAMLLIPSLGLFRHIQEQYRLCRALMRGQGIDLVMRTIRARLSERVEQELRRVLPAPINPTTVTVTAQAVVGTFLALLQWWLEMEMPLRPEEMDAYFRQLVLPGVQQLVERGE